MPSQKNKPLDIITDYPIKIDGGASFFTYDSINLNSKKYILIVSKDKQAFIQTSKGFVYFKRKKREITEKGYRDIYINNNVSLILNINKITKTGDYSSVRSGTLELKDTKGFLVQIHGEVDELDKYNYPNKFK